jgi:hypothetical protein
MNSALSLNRSLLILAFTVLAACSETIDATYKTRALAENGGAIAAGWVPAWLPSDAMQIRETHHTGTKAMMVRFTFPTESKLSIPSACLPVTATAVRPPPFERAWWPKTVPELLGTTPKYEYWQCASQYAAVLQSEGVGFVWSAPR